MSDAWDVDRPDASRPVTPAAFPGAKRSADPAESVHDKWAGPEPANSAGEAARLGVAIPLLPEHPAEAETTSRQDPAAAEQSDVPRVDLPILAVSHAAAEELKECQVPATASLVRPDVLPAQRQVRSLLELVLPAEARREEAVSVPKEPVPVSVLPEPAAAASQPAEWACRA
jgi:hypothetical protein